MVAYRQLFDDEQRLWLAAKVDKLERELQGNLNVWREILGEQDAKSKRHDCVQVSAQGGLRRGPCDDDQGSEAGGNAGRGQRPEVGSLFPRRSQRNGTECHDDSSVGESIR